MIYYLFLANRMQVDLTDLAKQKTEYKFIGFRKIQQLAENIIFLVIPLILVIIQFLVIWVQIGAADPVFWGVSRNPPVL